MIPPLCAHLQKVRCTARWHGVHVPPTEVPAGEKTVAFGVRSIGTVASTCSSHCSNPSSAIGKFSVEPFTG